MELSLARTLTGYSEFYESPFPPLTSTPLHENVTPGLGQIVNLYETIVPMRGQTLHTLEKSAEVIKDEIESDVVVKNALEQIGSGETKINPEILQSFKHPIVTDSIVFPTKKESKRKSENELEGNGEKQKKRKIIAHKFAVV